MILLIILKPIAYVITALSTNKPLWETFIIFMIASTVPNALIYYSSNIFTEIKNKIRKTASKPKKENGLRQKTHATVWGWSQKFRMLPVFLFFLGPLFLVPFFAQVCLVIGRILKIPFIFFALIPAIQFFLIYFLRQQFF
ncbi:MAG: hypothetical protein Q8N90_01170 [bacterium]|nr:hypothetical protein [bacterium]